MQLLDRHLPDFAYLGLLVGYFVAAYYFDGFGVVVGFALGVASQMCLDWKHERAMRQIRQSWMTKEPHHER